MFFKRVLRGQIPSLPRTAPPVKEMEEQREKLLVRSRQREYKHAGKTPLSIGDRVLMQDHTTKLWKHKGVIASIRDHGVSYQVTGSQGRSFTRNRQQLKLQPQRPTTPRDPTPPKRNQTEIEDVHEEVVEEKVDDTAPTPTPPPTSEPRRGRRSRTKKIQWDV